ncbi:hypothetical protein [Tenacibaculum sp. SDUM215027]|uniref:hypothetical protein n=1 Tax=Tenacibaculum sp. SDUM215027 TaxID=3422596 RepID=UPI003D31532B
MLKTFLKLSGVLELSNLDQKEIKGGTNENNEVYPYLCWDSAVGTSDNYQSSIDVSGDGIVCTPNVIDSQGTPIKAG